MAEALIAAAAARAALVAYLRNTPTNTGFMDFMHASPMDEAVKVFEDDEEGDDEDS